MHGCGTMPLISLVPAHAGRKRKRSNAAASHQGQQPEEAVHPIQSAPAPPQQSQGHADDLLQLLGQQGQQRAAKAGTAGERLLASHLTF